MESDPAHRQPNSTRAAVRGRHTRTRPAPARRGRRLDLHAVAPDLTGPHLQGVEIPMLLIVAGLLLLGLIGLVSRTQWRPQQVGWQASSAPPAATAAAATAPTATPELVAGAVRLTVYDAAGGTSEGTGALLTADGFILSSYHVVGDTTGRLRNPGEIAWVAFATAAGEVPSDEYLARVRVVDRSLDLALLRIIATPDGSPVTLPLGRTPMPVGEGAALSPGDELTLLWFPSPGPAPARTMRGRIAEVSDSWIRLDVPFDSAGSGLALDAQGRLAGIEVNVVEKPATNGRTLHILPVHLVREWIAAGTEREE